MAIRWFVFCALILTHIGVSGQSVVAVQGDSYANTNIRLDFTLGEVIIATVSDTSQILTQGFHQTQWELTSIDDFDVLYTANVFPNPTSQYLTVEVERFQGIDYVMYDLIGKVVVQGRLASSQTDIAVQFLSEGSYILVLSEQSQILKSFKLIKHN